MDAAGGAGDAADTARLAWLRRAVYAVVALGLVAFVVRGADGPADPVLAPERTAAPAPAGAAPAAGCGTTRGLTPFPGFGEVAFTVTAADGTTAFDGCAHLAATPEARAEGLMGKADLGGYDAMVFRFDAPSTGGFFMFRTVVPLSIAFIGADGGLVSATDMAPCTEQEASACPSFPPAGPYLHAVEVPQGALARLGIVPGATVAFGEGSPAG